MPTMQQHSTSAYQHLVKEEERATNLLDLEPGFAAVLSLLLGLGSLSDGGVYVHRVGHGGCGRGEARGPGTALANEVAVLITCLARPTRSRLP